MNTLEFHWQLMGLSYQLKEQATQLVQPFCTENALTPALLRVLMALYFGGEVTLKELSDRTFMANANASAACKKLEEMQLVIRRRDENDERQLLIKLSPQGKNLMARLHRHHSEQSTTLLEKLSKEDAKQLAACLERLSDVIQNKETPYEQ